MPGFDRSGPMGAGPMSGGRRGRCNTANTGYGTRPAGTFGFGRGMGFGRGFRGGFSRGMGRTFVRGGWNQPSYYPAYGLNPEDELNMLKTEANSVKNSLDKIRQRIAELEKSSE